MKRKTDDLDYLDDIIQIEYTNELGRKVCSFTNPVKARNFYLRQQQQNTDPKILPVRYKVGYSETAPEPSERAIVPVDPVNLKCPQMQLPEHIKEGAVPRSERWTISKTMLYLTLQDLGAVDTSTGASCSEIDSRSEELGQRIYFSKYLPFLIAGQITGHLGLLQVDGESGLVVYLTPAGQALEPLKEYEKYSRRKTHGWFIPPKKNFQPVKKVGHPYYKRYIRTQEPSGEDLTRFWSM